MTESVTPQRALAQRLLAPKTSGDRASYSAVEAVAAAESAFERLHAHLSKSIGAAGFRMLLGRAIERSRSQHPFLANLPSLGDSEWPVSGLTRSIRAERPAEVEEALVILLTTFISLLGRFVGDGLAMRLVEESWPGTSGGASTKSGRGAEPNG